MSPENLDDRPSPPQPTIANELHAAERALESHQKEQQRLERNGIGIYRGTLQPTHESALRRRIHVLQVVADLNVHENPPTPRSERPKGVVDTLFWLFTKDPPGGWAK